MRSVVLPRTGVIGVSLTCSDIDVEKNVRFMSNTNHGKFNAPASIHSIIVS